MSPRRWWRWSLVGTLALATVVLLVLSFTPVMGVRSVQVSGVRVLQKKQVVEAAGVAVGTPMLRVDEEAIRGRVSRMPRVDSVRVGLVWPSTVRVQVTERVPVAVDVVPGGFRLVDDDGVAFATVRERPPELPEIRVADVAPSDRATRAALTVLTALPDSVVRRVKAVVAEKPDDVRLLLTRGRTVEWGSTRLTDRKASILPVLLTREGDVYDVTSPALPTVS